MNTPLVSVILPTYNGNHAWLSQAIDSVINQTYTHWELIIINDSSTNDIEKTIGGYMEKDERIKYLKNEKNMERSYSKNRGISLSQGDYIAFIDDDDIWSDYMKLEKQINFLEKNTDYVMVGCASIIQIDEEGNQTSRSNNKIGYEAIQKKILTSNQFAQSSICARKNIIQSVGGFPIWLHLSEDYYLRLSLGIVGKITNIDSEIKYRNRSGNSTNTKKVRMFLSNIMMTFIFKNYYPGFWIALIKKIGYFILPQKISNFLLYLSSKHTSNQSKS